MQHSRAGMEGASQRTVGDYVLEKHIGSGSFAVVWKGRHRATGEAVAVKEIRLDKLNRKLRQSLESEVSILQRIAHPNIVTLQQAIEVRGGCLAPHDRRATVVGPPSVPPAPRGRIAGLKRVGARHPPAKSNGREPEPTPAPTRPARAQEGNKMYLVMEYCAGGDLAAYIRRCRCVPEATARGLLQQLSAGLREMWAHHLVHVSCGYCWSCVSARCN